MRKITRGAVWIALVGFGALSVADRAAEAKPKRKPVCTYKRVPVSYCVGANRRLDCTGKIWRTDRICK